MANRFDRFAMFVARKSGHFGTFLMANLIVILWASTGGLFDFSDTWQLVINTGTTIITFLMVFLLQHTQVRDTEAIQAKLDELVKAMPGASNKVIGKERR